MRVEDLQLSRLLQSSLGAAIVALIPSRRHDPMETVEVSDWHIIDFDSLSSLSLVAVFELLQQM